MPKAIKNLNDIVGKKYGKLTVVKYLETVYKKKNRDHYYECICDCGQKNIRASRHMLIKGDKKSCGCARKDAGKRRLIDMTGRKYGRWTVLHRANDRISEAGTVTTMWTCQCECGTIKDVTARSLRTGMSKSCGCLQKEIASQKFADDLTGLEFGYLTPIERVESYRSSSKTKVAVQAVWRCVCRCGNEIDVLAFSLKDGDTTSCGCKKQSKYEMYVEEYLQKCGYIKDVDYFKEKTFDDLLGVGGGDLRFDFYVILSTGEHVLIECQGEQHYRSFDWYGGDEYFSKLQANDQIKKDFCDEKAIKLIEVDYKKVLYDDVVNVLKNNNII